MKIRYPATMSTTTRRRLTGGVLIAVVLIATAAYLSVRAVQANSNGQATFDFTRPDSVFYVDDISGRVRQTSLDRPGQASAPGPFCYRSYIAGNTLVCLRPNTLGFEAAIFDQTMTEVKTIDLWGTPSRTRVSPSGRLVTWTVFHFGDAYLTEGEFATIASIYNIDTGHYYGTLEEFTVSVEGKPFKAINANFWGVTFAPDDRTFYATMAADGKTWLMRGDLNNHSLTALQNNVECPSLSPDATRIAYKKRAGGQWRLHILDLATGTQTPLAETQNVDDQPEWLDNHTIAYARPVSGRQTTFAVAANGTGAPRILVDAASSPAVVRAT